LLIALRIKGGFKIKNISIKASLRGTKQSLHMQINQTGRNCRAEIASFLAMTWLV